MEGSKVNTAKVMVQYALEDVGGCVVIVLNLPCDYFIPDFTFIHYMRIGVVWCPPLFLMYSER